MYGSQNNKEMNRKGKEQMKQTQPAIKYQLDPVHHQIL